MRNGFQPILMLAAVLTTTLTACQTETRATVGFPVQIEDSAGVRVIEHAGTPVADAPFRFAAEPRYRHGTNPGDYAFQGIHPGSLLPDGSAIVSDVLNKELVVLSPDGASHEVLAGPGEGPGEVNYVLAVFALGQDRVLAADRDLDRVTVFAGGAVERTVDIRHANGLGVKGIGAVIGGPMPLFTSPFGDAEGRVWLPSDEPGDAREGASRYAVISADGEWLGTVEAPLRLRILDVAGGLVLGVQLDELDVENVVVYELVGSG